MKHLYKIHPDFTEFEKELHDIILNYEDKGVAFGNQKRNSLRLFELNGETINIKSFRKPNFFNKIAYRFFRKSKAERSFKYAIKLTKLGVGTPKPIAYSELFNMLTFSKSFYVSKHWDVDLTYRELIENYEYPDYDKILRAFTRFTYQLHEKNINFLDHSPGNTLIKKVGDSYEFALVDLNRMKFEPLDFNACMKNFARLSKHKQMVEVMSDEYAKCCNKPYVEVFNAMWREVQRFRAKKERKKNLKKLFKL